MIHDYITITIPMIIYNNCYILYNIYVTDIFIYYMYIMLNSQIQCLTQIITEKVSLTGF